MSRPPRRMLPSVGSSSLTSSRASVVLPHPDSPTIATVSPRCSMKLTPSTACAAPSPRRRGGKCLTTASTSSRGGPLPRPWLSAMKEALRKVARARPGSRYAGQGRASAMQIASACGQRGWKGHPEGNRARYGGAPGIGESCPRRLTCGCDCKRPAVYGCAGRGKTSATGATSDSSGVHDSYPLGCFSDDAEVVVIRMRDMFRLDLERPEQLDDLRLDSHVERALSARRRSARRARARRPSQSSRVAAFRLRIGAGSRRGGPSGGDADAVELLGGRGPSRTSRGAAVDAKDLGQLVADGEDGVQGSGS